jgi:hypothetical protein
MSADEDLFYRKLAELDKGLADRWKKVSGGSLAKTIDPGQLEDIFVPMFQTKKISAKQAEALNYLYVRISDKLTPEAWTELYILIEAGYEQDFFFAGSNAQLKSGDELKEFHGALGAALGKIDFTSARTGVTYSPDQYAAIKQLVADGKITVFEVDAAWLHAKGGLYRSDIDRLIIYKGAPPIVRQYMIVHEVTHAIQDWLDVSKRAWFHEADAYIAAAAAALGVNEQTYNVMQEYPEQKAAAQLVLDKKAVPKNTAWNDAYMALVKAIGASSTYAGQEKAIFAGKQPAEKGKGEKKILLDIMNKMKKAKP